VYETHYGFSEKPFNLTPDPKYLFLSHRHTEAFAHLEFGGRERGGFILITGEVGTGKTTLARYFLSRLDSRTATAFVLYPALTAAELLRSILEDLHIPSAGTSLKDHVDSLHRFLLQAREQNRDVVLLIDEAQDLSTEVLEQVRLISNLETDTEKLIQIVLMGQSELQELLSRRELRQLAQRVTAQYHLSPLSRPETEDYVAHRLRVAGGEGKVSFTSGALAAVHQHSGGVPRIINLVCDRSLLAGYVAGTRVVDAGMVRRAAREVTRFSPGRSLLRYAALVGLPAAAVLAGLGLWYSRPELAPLAAQPAATTPAAAPSAAAVSGAPSAAPAPPASVAAVAPAAPAASPLAPVVLTLDHDRSFQSAVGQVQALWGPDALERTSLRTHMEQVRRLNLPVVMEMFHPSRKDTCFVALIRLEGDQAVLAADGVPMTVPVAEVDRLWTRQAVFLWRDFDALAPGGDPERTNAWVRQVLIRLGYPAQDPDLAQAVARFQQDAELAADGVVGTRTLMTLYSRSHYPRPRLSGGAS
jgi:general secretion pathway protein A